MSMASVCPLPGPRSAIPGRLMWQFRRSPLEFLSRMHRDFGDVVTWPVGSWQYVLLTDPDHVRQVLVSESHRFTKGPALQRAKIALGEGLLTSEGDHHKRQRRLSQPAFHAKRVEAYAPAMIAHTQRVASQWTDGQTLDMHEHMMELTLSIVAAALFGAEIDAHKVHVIGDAMTRSVRMFTRALLPWGPLLARLPLPSNYRYLAGRRVLEETIQQMIDRRRNSTESRDEARDDFLSILLRARDVEGDQGGMSDQQLRDEAITIFMAGHETTANALTFAWMLLSENPDVEQKLHEEIDRVLGSGSRSRTPTLDDLDHLPYTRAVMAEAMRLYPPAWIIGRRCIKPLPLGPYTIPEGAVVLLSQWVTHRDPRWWPDPHRFLPDRWLDEPAQRPRPRWTYFPFGGGPRQCIGEPMAWLEGLLILPTIARHWRFRRTTDTPVDLEPTITLRPRAGLPMTVTRRE